MGIYLNPKNKLFAVSISSDIYVDKTELIAYTNKFIGKERPLIGSSRPRRFGKIVFRLENFQMFIIQKLLE